MSCADETVLPVWMDVDGIIDGLCRIFGRSNAEDFMIDPVRTSRIDPKIPCLGSSE